MLFSAEYLCYSLQDAGYKGPAVTLKIIDVVNLVSQNK